MRPTIRLARTRDDNQELAGHQELGTTQRYMHLSPAALDAAIRLLEPSRISQTHGDILETGGGRSENVLS